MRSTIVITVAVLMTATLVTSAQIRADRERARVQNKLGWEDMRVEAWDKAARSFQNAIDIDPTFEIAHYGLGRANMALKKFDAAIAAYERCRDLYEAQAGRRFANAQEAQRYRRDRVTEINAQLAEVQSRPMNAARQDMERQLQNQRHDIEESIQRGDDTTISAKVPAYVSFALGSAYFRSGRLRDAEIEYKATIASDSKSGEAHSNLAVVYLETGRFADAHTSLQNAKKTGFKVNPQLERAIQEKRP